ncbi:MAG: hypothetical protein M1821_002249 [Bathelium mastoideum]|nr:MAG: hypothetical protein M1821_002249 [Bathelium mastoideum]
MSEKTPLTGLSRRSSGSRFASILSTEAWLWEIVGVFLAAGSFIALIAILNQFNERQLPDWAGGVTLNFIISLLSTAFKGSLMLPVGSCISQLGWVAFTKRSRLLRDVTYYNDASRGPGGSLRMLAGLGISQFVSLGAVITVASLAFDPFFQQLVRYKSSFVPDTNLIASTSVAYTYNGTHVTPSAPSQGPESWPLSYYIPLRMSRAMQGGLTSSTLVPLPVVPQNCPSGTCVWDPFGTLAIGINCIDISYDFEMNCTPTQSGAHKVKTSDSEFIEPAFDYVLNASVVARQLSVNPESGASTATILPTPFLHSRSGNSTNDSETCAIGTTSSNGDTKQLINGTSGDTVMIFQTVTPDQCVESKWCPFNFSQYNAPLAWVQWVRAVDEDLFFEGSFASSYLRRNTSLQAGRCTLFTEVQAISASMSNGTYSEDLLGETPLASGGPDDLSAPDQSFFARNYDSSFKFHSLFPDLTNADKDFTLPVFNWRILYNALSVVLGGTNSYGNSSDQRYLGRTTFEIPTTTADNSFLVDLWTADNVTQQMSNIAQYITVALRSNDTILLRAANPSSTVIADTNSINGIVQVQQTKVEVHWLWLILPAITFLAVAILLAVTISRSYPDRVGIWKSSPLALLFNTDQRGLELCREASEMHTSEKGMARASERLSLKIIADQGILFDAV